MANLMTMTWALNWAVVLGTLTDMFWAAIPAIGFAMVFNVPPRSLPAVALLGAAGHGLRWLLMQYHWTVVPASLAGAILIGFMAVYLAKRLHAPAQIFGIAGVIPMIPGVHAFKTMIGLVQLATHAGVADSLLLETSIHATQTGMILGALATGIAAPKLLFERHQPVV